VKKGPPPSVYSITGAATPHSDDLDSRIRRYLISMGIRTVCVLLVLVVHSPVRWVFAILAVVLPYIAVVMANVARRHTEPPPTPVSRVSLPGDVSESGYSPSSDSVPEPPHPQSQKWTA
jgi:hypothetical protein